MTDGEKGMALLIALMGTTIRDAHTVGNVATLGDVKPVSQKARVKAAKDGGEIAKLPDELREWVENYEEKGVK